MAWIIRTALTIGAASLLIIGAGAHSAEAKPSGARCKKMWRKGPQEKVLRCTPRSGSRRTNSLAGKRYLTNVGTCWDYDVVVSQSCGCRLFSRASICCWKRGRRTCPDFRIGSSRPVDCRKYGRPRYGASGKTMSAACKAKAKAAAAFAFCRNGKFSSVAMTGCRASVSVSCGTKAQLRALLAEKSGPRVESYPGCKLIERCSGKEGLACYRKLLAKKGQAAARGKGPAPAKSAALIKRLNSALAVGSSAQFLALWHPEAYKANLVGMTGLSATQFYTWLKRKGYTLKVQGFGKIHGHGMPAMVYLRMLKDGKVDATYTAVMIDHGGYKLLGVGKKTSLLSALGLRWIKQKKK
jgi:hypothetical protein